MQCCTWLGRRKAGRAIDLPRGVEARREYDALTIADRSTYPSPVRVTGEHPVIVPSVGGEGTRSSAGGWQVEMQVIEPEHSAPVREDATAGHTAMLCLEALGDSVTVRTRLPGDRFQPSGMTVNQKAPGLLHRRQNPSRAARRHPPVGLRAWYRLGGGPPSGRLGNVHCWNSIGASPLYPSIAFHPGRFAP